MSIQALNTRAEQRHTSTQAEGSTSSGRAAAHHSVLARVASVQRGNNAVGLTLGGLLAHGEPREELDVVHEFAGRPPVVVDDMPRWRGERHLDVTRRIEHGLSPLEAAVPSSQHSRFLAEPGTHKTRHGPASPLPGPFAVGTGEFGFVLCQVEPDFRHGQAAVVGIAPLVPDDLAPVTADPDEHRAAAPPSAIGLREHHLTRLVGRQQRAVRPQQRVRIPPRTSVKHLSDHVLVINQELEFNRIPGRVHRQEYGCDQATRHLTRLDNASTRFPITSRCRAINHSRQAAQLNTITTDRYRIFAITCPFHGAAGWRWIRDNDPHGWAEAVEFDRAIRHGYPRATKQGQGLRGQYFLHRCCTPLDQVDLDTPARSKRHLRLITAESARDEDGDPDGCSPWSCRSGEPVTGVGSTERAA